MVMFGFNDAMANTFISNLLVKEVGWWVGESRSLVFYEHMLSRTLYKSIYSYRQIFFDAAPRHRYPTGYKVSTFNSRSSSKIKSEPGPRPPAVTPLDGRRRRCLFSLRLRSEGIAAPLETDRRKTKTISRRLQREGRIFGFWSTVRW